MTTKKRSILFVDDGQLLQEKEGRGGIGSLKTFRIFGCSTHTKNKRLNHDLIQQALKLAAEINEAELRT